MFTWKCKQQNELDVNELNEVVDFLMGHRSVEIDYRITALNQELERVKAENKRLWECLGTRSA